MNDGPELESCLELRHVGRGVVKETQNRVNRHTYNNTTQALGNTHTQNT